MISDKIIENKNYKEVNNAVAQKGKGIPQVAQQAKIEVMLTSLFKRVVSAIFSEEIIQGVSCFQNYFTWNQKSLLALGMIASNISLGATLPIKHSLFNAFLKAVQKDSSSFNAYCYPLMQFLGVLGGIVVIHQMNAYCTKKLRDLLGSTIRAELGDEFFNDNSFYLIRHIKNGIGLPTIGTGLVRAPVFASDDWIDLINNRISVLCHFLGSLISLYQISDWLVLTVLGINISVPYLVVVCLVYSWVYNLLTESLDGVVKNHMQKVTSQEDSMSKHVNGIPAKAESIAFLEGGGFENNIFQTKNKEVQQIKESALWPKTQLEGLQKMHRELIGILVTLAQLVRGTFDIASITSITNSFTYVVATMCWRSDKLTSLQRLESNLSNLKKFRIAIAECQELIKNAKVKYNHDGNIIKLNLTIPRIGSDDVFKLEKDLKPGKHYRIIGLNGAGKTTLLKIIKFKMRPQLGDGSVSIPENTHFHPQEPYILNDKQYSLLEQCFYPNQVDTLKKGLAEELMERLNFFANKAAYTDLEKNNFCNWFEQLSGGQKQKIELIRSILNKGSFACFDEPLASLDEDSKPAFKQIIKEHLSDIPILYIEHKTEDGANYDILKGENAPPIAIIEEML